MSISRFWQILTLSACLGLWACPGEKAAEWRVPETKPAGTAGEQIAYGEKLITQSAKYLGPQAAPEMRLAGNQMACSNCHLDKGTNQKAMGFVGIPRRYPLYYAPWGREVSLADRIQACFERSLNGKTLPEKETQAFVAYMEWLSAEIPAEQAAPVAALPVIELPNRPADLKAGKAVYEYSCQACHGEQGLGLLQSQAHPEQGYTFPPLAGPDSFSQGSNLARLGVAARYIYANMPLGRAVLSEAEAYDVAAYMNSLPRPAFKPQTGRDYPELSQKPFDVPYGPWSDNLPESRHRLGPLPLEEAQTQQN